MNNKYLIVLIAIIFIASYLIGKNIINPDQARNDGIEKKVIISQCNPVKNKCSVPISGGIITYSILDTPSALTKFRVEVQALNISPDSIRVNFLMRNMDMGKIDYILDNEGRDVWAQNVILPVCSLGRNNWINVVAILHKESRWFVEFNFNT